MGVDLGVNILGLKLENPFILASGILGTSAKLFERVEEAGAAAIVTKSISIEPRNGYELPIVAEVEYGLINCVGLANPGYRALIDEIESANVKIPIIVSIFGENVKDYGFLARKLSDYADAFELNISCPHAKVSEFLSNAKVVEKIAREVKQNTDLKFSVKIGLLCNLKEIVKACMNYANAITAINTVPAMKINTEFFKPILSNKFGGLSGPAIKYIAVKAVYDIYENCEGKLEVVGCGGIMNACDAIEFMLAGAKALEIGTGIYYKGLSIFENLCKDVEEFLKQHKIQKISEIVGRAHDC